MKSTDLISVFCRPVPFWSWNDKLEPDELRRQIGAMQDAGMGGFFMHARGGLETEYLSEDWFRAVEASVDEAKKRGMQAWCYDENGWPSGFAGGKLLEDPENRAHYLRFEKKPGFDAAALGVYTLENGHLRRVTGAANGISEYLCVYDCQNSSTVDILDPRITDAFLALTHEKYFERFGAEFGKGIAGFFTDEPQYFRYETAYTPVLLTEYKKAYGADILDLLGALFVDCEEAPGFRFRYWRLMNVLYTENFMGRVYRWCLSHNCHLTGHTVEESQLYTQMWCCAGVMPFYEYESIPGVDWLGRKIGTELAPRQVSSAAQQLGKKQVLTETFACAGWDVTPKELKRIAEWQYVNGVNLMCQHLYPYSIRGQRKRDYPAFYSEHNPWTDELKTFDDYFTELGYLLANSREQADVLILHPIHSAYLTFDRANDEASVRNVGEPFNVLIERFGAAGIGHHYGDERLMEKYGSVKDGRLTIGECTYSFVVIPDCDTLDSSTAALLKDYLSQGGRLMLAGRKPTRIDGELADLSFLQGNLTWDELVRERALLPEANRDVRCTLRFAENGNFLFAVNLSETDTADMSVKLPFAGVEAYDLLTHKTKSVAFEKTTDGIAAKLHLAPGESVLLMQNDSAIPQTQKSHIAEAMELGGTWTLSAPVQNSLTLDKAALSYDGKTYTEPLPVPYISERLLREKTNRKIWLRYAFTADYLPDDLTLELETLQHTKLSVNGTEISLTGQGVLDRSFVRGNIAALARKGENEIVLELDYFQSQQTYDVFDGFYYGNGEVTETLMNCVSYETNIEAMYLFGSFAVRPDSGWQAGENGVRFGDRFRLCAPATDLDLQDITVQGFPFFHGAMRLKRTITVQSTNWQLRCAGRVQYMRVFVNGQKAGTLLFSDTLDLSPYLHPGENVLELELMASNRNLLGPHHNAAEPEPLFVDPTLFSLYGSWHDGKSEGYRANYAFVRFGLDTLQLERNLL